MPRALITTIPFGERDATPLHMLHASGIDFTINPLGRKVTERELAELIADFDILIAGTEPVTEYVIAQADRLNLSRAWGLDWRVLTCWLRSGGK